MALPTRLRRNRSAQRIAHRPRLEWLERRDLLASYTTPEDTALVVADPALAGMVVVRPPEHGVVQRTNAGGFAYLPARDYFGPDRFTYTIVTSTTPANVPGDVAEVTIAVTPVNDPPVAFANEYAALRNTPLTIAAPGVLKNDKDVDSEHLRAALVAQAAHGVVSLAEDGGFTYTPEANYTGPDSFTYRVSDGTVSGNEARVFLNVRGLPDARDDQYSVAQGGVLSVAPRGVLANDLGVGDRGLIASLEPGDANQPRHGSVTVNADGSFTYRPDPTYSGPDSFVYRATDNTPALTPGGTIANPLPPAFDLARVHIYVRPSPIVRANPDVFETFVNRPLVIEPPGVLKNDYVLYVEPTTGASTTALNILPPNAPLTAALITKPEIGELLFRENGSFEYTPRTDFAGTVTFTYQARLSTTASGVPAGAGDVRSDITTVTIRVKAPEPPPGPVARNDFYVAAANTTLSIRAPGVLANDSAPPTTTSTDAANNRPLVAALVEQPSHGTVLLRPNGSFDYKPDPDFVGADTFTYQVSLPPPTDPTTGATVAGAAPVLSNIATVTIRVAPALARNDEYSTLQNVPLNVEAPGVLTNDAGGSEEHPLEAVVVARPLHGQLELRPSGAFVYTPNPNFTGADVFTYRAETDLALPPPPTDPVPLGSNADGRTIVEPHGNLAIVKIYVRAARPTVQAYPDKYATPQNVALVVPAPGVFANDYALVNHRIEASLAEQPAHGTVNLSADGGFTYTPAQGFVGEDKFVYKATDLDAAASSSPLNNVSFATVFIRVHDELAPPRFIAGGNLRATDEDGHQQVAEWATLLALAGDGQPAFTVSTDQPHLFLAPPALDVAGQLSYTPAPNAQGTAQVTVVLEGDAEAATFTIEIEKPHPLFNADNEFDVTADKNVVAGDALAIINHVNAYGITSAIAAEGESAARLYLDVSKNNVVSALDALLVINYLNAGAGSSVAAEGESAALQDLSLLALLADDTSGPRKRR